MEVRELILAAFGPFTDKALAFDQEAGVLQLVYGPNEAGKSSALRGLKALLYGIPDRTQDNFIHAHNALRIAGRLRAGNGQELGFVRRKGRKNTLSSMHGEPLEETALAPFLQGVTPALFETLFGIDYQALVLGGQEILAQKGEVGQALFSAALGSQGLRSVLANLDQEADALFRPKGSTQKINAALKQYGALKTQIKDTSLPSQKWKESDLALARSLDELSRLEQNLARARTELSRLRRAQRTLPKLARRRELLHKLTALGDIIALAEDFSERRQEAARKKATAQELVQGASYGLERLSMQLAELTVRQTILDEGEKIEALHGRLGAHRKAMQDRPNLEAEHKQLLADAKALLRDVRPDVALEDAETLRPMFARRQHINVLSNQFERLSARVNHTEKDVREIQARLEQARTQRLQLSAANSPDSLRRDTAAARKLGDLDNVIQTERLELEALKAQCNDDLARLTLWCGPLRDVAGLPVPMRASVDRFDRRYEELSKHVQRLQEKHGEFQATLQETVRQLDEIHNAGAVPTEDDLNEARSVRDRTWGLLRRHWISREDVAAQASASHAEPSLPEVFEGHLIRADELADRLRREADRVHKQANLMATRDNATQSAADLAGQIEVCTDLQRTIDAEWAALWQAAGLHHPRTPREMREWLNRLDNLREKANRLSALHQQIDAREQTRNLHIDGLNRDLRALGAELPDSASLEAVLTHSEEVVAGLEALARQCELLDKDIQVYEPALKSGRADQHAAISDLDAWKRQWKNAVEGLGLGDDASPLEAADVLEKLRALFEKRNEIEKSQIRIQQIDDDAARFHNDAGLQAHRVAPELSDLAVEEAVARLNTLLADNRTHQSQRAQIEEQVRQAHDKIREYESTIETMTARLNDLCVEARCDSYVALETAERRSAEYRQLREEVDSVEKDVLDAGEGATLAALEAETREVDRDTLPGEIKALTARIDEELDPARTALAARKGGQEKELELMNGGEDAAALAEQAQAVLASIRSSAARYTRVKLAARILRDEIERYRNDNQGSLVRRTSEHFAVLTRNSFQTLLTDFNEKDEAVLVGARASGERVRVEDMSAGTRAQLYLALRLASLEKYMETAESMPFVVDDILVDFDDERSAAALQALARLAQRTQVILFTHHHRLVEQAQAADGAVQVHLL